MKRIAAVLSAVVVLLLCAGVSYAEQKTTIGQFTLRYQKLSIAENAIIARNATLISSTATISADTIRADLTSSGAFAKGEATGHVKIRAKQFDAQGGFRTIDATGQTATMVQGQDTVVVRGNVVAIVTDPKVFAAPAKITGETMTIYLKERKVDVEAAAGQESEMVITPKEK